MFRVAFSSLTEKEIQKIAIEKINSETEEWEKEIWQFINDWLDPAIGSIKVFTSGSTGIPKEIQHGKGCILNSARLTCYALHLKHGDKALLCLPVNRISGMMMIVRSIWNKMDLYCIRPTSDPLSQLTDKDKFDFAAFTPSQLYEFEKHVKRIEKIRKLLIGGEDISARLMNNLQLLNNAAYATFGMTETISHIALRRLNGPHPERYFKTLGGITVSTDQRKCLIIEAPELGIHGLITNDIVHLISPVEFEWLGRKDNLINSAGVKIYPEQIEEQLKAVIDVPFFIAGIENQRTGQEVAIALEKRAVTLKETNDFKKRFEILGKLYSPKTILTIPHFIRTENGKINRKASLQQVAMRISI